MPKRILITGCAGFVGSHLADEFLRQGHRVRMLDSVLPLTGAEDPLANTDVSSDVEFLQGQVEDPQQIAAALRGVDAVYHLAARPDASVSINNRQAATNNAGTAVLLEALLKHPVERLVIASSMHIYGEGLYQNAAGEFVPGRMRSLEQLKSGDWELRDAAGLRLTPVPTPETKEPSPASSYAFSEFDQERMCLLVGRAYGIPTVALRFFNVYGPRQSFANPSTGLLTFLASKFLSGIQPLLLEDGRQRRDFVHVRDVVDACCLALEAEEAADQTINVGSGVSLSVMEISEHLARALGTDIQADTAQRYRLGDPRYCFADISRARELLGYNPQVSIEEGLADLAEELVEQSAVTPGDHRH